MSFLHFFRSNKHFEYLVGIVPYDGIIAVRLQIDGNAQLTFVNMHLPAGEGKLEERCKLWKLFFSQYKYQYDYMFAFGDQNWQTQRTLNITQILQAIKKHDYQTIIDNEEVRI